MFALRRWWEQRGIQVALLALTIGGAAFLWQTRGSLAFDLYAFFARAFQTDPTALQELRDARVRELEAELVELKAQNKELKALLGYRPADRGDTIAAPIVGRSADRWWNELILGCGRVDGVREDYVAVGAGGLVGRVVSVTDRTSRVLLVNDPTNHIGVTISRSRAMGYMRGRGSDRAVMEFYDQVPDVKVGDEIATSRYSVLYPPGIPIGKVSSIVRGKAAPEAEVKLYAPINRIEWVTIVPHEAIRDTEVEVEKPPVKPQEETESESEMEALSPVEGGAIIEEGEEGAF